MEQKKILLHQMLSKLPITDFDMLEVSKTYVDGNGWNDNKDFEMAYKDCLCYMAIRLANKKN